jgi:hypothetical protein
MGEQDETKAGDIEKGGKKEREPILGYRFLKFEGQFVGFCSVAFFGTWFVLLAMKLIGVLFARGLF